MPASDPDRGCTRTNGAAVVSDAAASLSGLVAVTLSSFTGLVAVTSFGVSAAIRSCGASPNATRSLARAIGVAMRVQTTATRAVRRMTGFPLPLYKSSRGNPRTAESQSENDAHGPERAKSFLHLWFWRRRAGM